MPSPDRHALAIAHMRRGRVVWLVVSTRDGRWTLPKGRADAGEASLSAAIRETAEESGVVGVPVAGAPIVFAHRTRRGRLQTVVAYPARRVGRTSRAAGDRWRARRWASADDPRLPATLRAALRHLEVARARAA